MRLMPSDMRQTPVSSWVVKQILQVKSCQFASIPVYSPKSGDDIHVAVDLVWKQVGDTVTVISANVHLKGELAKTALFAKDDDSDVRNMVYDKRRKTVFGVVSGDLCYYLGDNEIRTPVLSSFDLKTE